MKNRNSLESGVEDVIRSRTINMHGTNELLQPKEIKGEKKKKKKVIYQHHLIPETGSNRPPSCSCLKAEEKN